MGERLTPDVLLGQWVDALWTTPCPHGGGYARDCTRCIHETLYASPWLADHEARLAARADRLAAKVRALAAEWEADASEARDGWREWGYDDEPGIAKVLTAHADRLRALLDDDPAPDRPPLPDRIDAVLRRSRNMREGLVEAIESGELAP